MSEEIRRDLWPPNALSVRSIDDAEYGQHLRNLTIYGYTIIQKFAERVLVDQLKVIIDAYWQEVADKKYAGRPDRDTRDKLVYNLQNRDKIFIDLLCVPPLRSLCMEKLNDRYYRFLPPDRPNYILSYYNARSSGAKLDLHIDSCVPNSGPWCTMMQVGYLLDDTSESNGCTVVVPGSHRSGEYTDRGLAKVTPIIGKAGDLVLWDSRLWHGTTENSAGTSRWALIATLTQWWIKQSMDIPRSLPEQIYSELDEEQKALLGFCSIPPRNESERINTKCGYEFLKPSVADFFR
jgi:Phytanoyl-CoA dioxygenase (PhyH)